MTIINCTPHAINVNGRTIEKSGILPRCQETTVSVGVFDGVQIVRRSYGLVTNLPEPVEGTLYIVSMLVRVACPDRVDLASPGDLVRDDAGNIIGSSNLVIN